MFYSLDSDDDMKSVSGSFRKKHAPTRDVKLEDEDV